MTREQLLALLAVLEGGGLIRPASDTNGRNAQLTAWSMGLDGVNARDAHEAVTNLMQSTTAEQYQVRPGDVRAEVGRIRKARFAATPPPLPDVDPDNVPAYQERRREQLAAIGDGRPVPNMIEPRRTP